MGAALCWTSLTGQGRAHAQEAEVLALSWQAPSGCPSAAEVRAEIARLLGGAIGGFAGGRLQARAVVTQGQVWAVVLETESSGQGGQRSLEAGSCAELANATALIIALMIDPDAVAEHTPPPTPSPPAPPVARPREGQATQPLQYHAGLIVMGSQGTLPSADVGVGGGLGLSGRRWRADVRASYGLRRDQKASAPLPPGGHGQFNFFSALLAGCFRLGGPDVEWGPCAVGEFGVTSAKGVGVERALPEQVPWWAVGAGGYAVIRLSRRWAVPLHGEALLPLRRSGYVFQDGKGDVSARVFKAARLGVRVSAGVELRF